jgi:hypothetical protein
MASVFPGDLSILFQKLIILTGLTCSNVLIICFSHFLVFSQKSVAMLSALSDAFSKAQFSPLAFFCLPAVQISSWIGLVYTCRVIITSIPEMATGGFGPLFDLGPSFMNLQTKDPMALFPTLSVGLIIANIEV